MKSLRIKLEDKPPYNSAFQNEFLKTFGLNTNIIYYNRIKDRATMYIQAYPLWDSSNKVVYLPCKFMNYICQYKY